MQNLSGQTLGQFQLLELIGQGGMASIYRAYQPSVKREVAIKVLASNLQDDRTFLERFYREVQLIANLQHPRIVPVYDFSEKEGNAYIAMAYLSGGTLADRIRQNPSGMSLKETIRIFAQIADALDFAHEKGIIHRDLKPSNILMDARDNAYVADFGLAKLLEQNQELSGNIFMGTPGYMAPDFTRPGSLTHKVDIYALGIMLFEMLSGRLPYQADTPAGLLVAHLVTSIPDIRSLRPDLPPAIQEIIQKAIAKEVADRYNSAAEILADLEKLAALLETGPVTLPPPVEAPPLPRPRQPLWVAGSLAVLILLLVSGGLLAFRGSFFAPAATATATPMVVHTPRLADPYDGARTWTFGCLGEAATALQDLQCRRILIALENRYLPFNYVDIKTNLPGGLDYEMWWQICTLLHCEPVFVEHRWDGLLEDVSVGKFDVGSGGITITEERKKTLDFSTSYLNIEQRLVARKGETRFTNILDFSSRSNLMLGAQVDSTNLEIAKRYLPAARIKPYSEYSVMLYSLIIGEVDAAIVDHASGQQLISGVVKTDADKLQLVGTSLSSDQLGLALSRRDSLVVPVNSALNEMRANGVLDALINQFYGPDFLLTYNDIGLGAYEP